MVPPTGKIGTIDPLVMVTRRSSERWIIHGTTVAYTAMTATARRIAR